ncbi:hypothetical protein [Mycetocola spongiae]|uniref:hypothetical protein n=1 Tax=Mycetocola spongiae TaxID=2859226 RepID=UPI001CF30BE0|nr:hypothetical protein [Mycetocola spongiae]UCR89270.1 hypothetical protein KXZ72_00710 [Mycetocola spongiae]
MIEILSKKQISPHTVEVELAPIEVRGIPRSSFSPRAVVVSRAQVSIAGKNVYTRLYRVTDGKHATEIFEDFRDLDPRISQIRGELTAELGKKATA